ncbi:hypothetical protein CCMA1212_008916 [Trichoderma ghanense]|uniref:Uncharacterized protein n=1 Tax=Trichoderma ghanense TaxID=65468 RepID=A0ABY2GTL6_9HYPO
MCTKTFVLESSPVTASWFMSQSSPIIKTKTSVTIVQGKGRRLDRHLFPQLIDLRMLLNNTRELLLEMKLLPRSRSRPA